MGLAIKKLSAQNVDSEDEEPKLLFEIPSFFKEVQRVRKGGNASPCLKKCCHLLVDESKCDICYLIMARTYFITTERHNIASSIVTGSIFSYQAMPTRAEKDPFEFAGFKPSPLA